MTTDDPTVKLTRRCSGLCWHCSEVAAAAELLREARRALQGHRVDARPLAEYSADVMARIDAHLAESLPAVPGRQRAEA